MDTHVKFGAYLSWIGKNVSWYFDNVNITRELSQNNDKSIKFTLMVVHEIVIGVITAFRLRRTSARYFSSKLRSS